MSILVIDGRPYELHPSVDAAAVVRRAHAVMDGKVRPPLDAADDELRLADGRTVRVGWRSVVTVEAQ